MKELTARSSGKYRSERRFPSDGDRCARQGDVQCVDGESFARRMFDMKLIVSGSYRYLLM